MQDNENIIKESIENLSMEQLAELKLDADAILEEIYRLIGECDEVLNKQ